MDEFERVYRSERWLDSSLRCTNHSRRALAQLVREKDARNELGRDECSLDGIYRALGQWSNRNKWCALRIIIDRDYLRGGERPAPGKWRGQNSKTEKEEGKEGRKDMKE